MANKKVFPKEEIILEGMEVLRVPFRNFSGRPTKFNPAGGRRFFNLNLDEDKAEELRAAGWKIRSLPPREEGDKWLHLFEVKLNYGGRPPKIMKVTPVGMETVTEDLIGLLDDADIEFADLTIRPYVYDKETAEFATAYVKTAYFNIKMDALELKYATEALEGTEDETDEVICDENGVCYINGVRIN